MSKRPAKGQDSKGYRGYAPQQEQPPIFREFAQQEPEQWRWSARLNLGAGHLSFSPDLKFPLKA